MALLKGDSGLRAQGPVFAVALLVFIIAGGTLGYIAIEGWSAWDAFYMTIITVTTVGYQEVHPLSRAGQAFTVVLLLSGVGAALYTFTLLATVVFEGGLPKRLLRRRQARMLDTIKDHFIICGYGRIGSIVARHSGGSRFRTWSSSTARNGCSWRSPKARSASKPTPAARMC